MTHQISMKRVMALGSKNVQEDLDNYVEALKTWAEHHKQVREDDKKPLPPEPKPEDFGHGDNESFEKAYQAWALELENRHQPYPMDAHCEDFMKAVSIDDALNVTTDYEIINDLPTPGDTLRQKKDALLGQISSEENQRVSALVPPGRVRHKELQVRKVQEADIARQNAFIKTLGDPKTMSPADLEVANKKLTARDLSEGRPPEDDKLLREFTAQVQKIDLIREQASALMNEVEDLTAENIDAWKPVWKE